MPRLGLIKSSPWTALLQVTDTKPKRPSWSGLPIGGDNAATAIAGLGYTVLIGDKEGNLHRWELATGRVSTAPTSQVVAFVPCGFMNEQITYEVAVRPAACTERLCSGRAW